MKQVALGFLWVYQRVLSPLIPSSCRFYPTCSVYSQEAVERYGVRIGVRLTVRRIARCHPWCKGGYDPVP